MADIFSLPNEILMLLLCHLHSCNDVRSFGNTCRRFRSFILTNKSKLPKPELKWDAVHLIFRRKISFIRRLRCIQRQGRKRCAHEGEEKWEFTEEEFSANFVNLFFMLTPRVMYIKCKDFDDNIDALVRKCVGTLRNSTLALEMDKCSLGEGALGDFFKHFSPFGLHLAGHFDRSIISDQVLPLSSLFALFIGVNRADMETCTRVSGITVRKIVNNWSKRYPDNCKDKSDLPPIDDYLSRNFTIEIPDCDLDYNEFFAFLRELIRVPHSTKERIMIAKLPKTLIHTIYNNSPAFGEIGPSLWVQEGICSVDDIKWCISLACLCNNGHAADHYYFLERNLPTDPSQFCDKVQMHLNISVTKREQMLRPRNHLLDMWITLKADAMIREKFVPETVLVTSSTPRKRRRTRDEA